MFCSDFVTIICICYWIPSDLPIQKSTIMKKEIRFLTICEKLMNGEVIDADGYEKVVIDNMLYDEFGMSAEEILEITASKS